MNSVGGYQQKAGAVARGGHNNAAPAQFQVGAVGFGPSIEEDDEEINLTTKGYRRVCDGMARSIVRLEQENEELRAEVAVLKEGMTILSGERDNWRAAANQAVADRDRNKSMADELAARVAVLEAEQPILAQFKVLAESLAKTQVELKQERDEWRRCAEKLHAAVCYFSPQILSEDGLTEEKEAVREFMRLKEGGQ